MSPEFNRASAELGPTRSRVAEPRHIREHAEPGSFSAPPPASAVLLPVRSAEHGRANTRFRRVPPGNAGEGTEPGAAVGPGSFGSRWARPKCSLPWDSRRLSSRKEIQTGRLPPDGGADAPRAGNRAACVSLGGAPPSSPNPSSSRRITTHQGLGDHEGGPCDAHLPSLSREPRGFDFKDLQLHSDSHHQLQPQFLASVPKKLGLESPEMPVVGSNLWGRS